MGRTKAFDEEAALAAAMRLFWKKGYGATSIGDLERAMALKRTSIYNTFGNKRALFQKSLLLYGRQVEEMLAKIMLESVDCHEAVRRWLTAVIDMQFSEEAPGGCLMILSVLESSQHDQQTKEMASAVLYREQAMLAHRLERGVASGELAPRMDCRAVAAAIAAASAGMVVLAMADYRRAALEEIARASLALLKDGE